MLPSFSRSWIVALVLGAGLSLIYSRAAAQEAEPGEEPPGKILPAPAPQPQLEQATRVEAAQKRTPRTGDVQKVFSIHMHARPLAEILSVFPATITFAEYGRTPNRGQALAVSAPPAVMAAIEETIKRLDVPPSPAKNIELTVEILEAVPAGAQGASVGPELQPVVAQLKRTFSFGGYRLADTLSARSREDAGLFVTSASGTEFVGLGRLDYRLHVRTVWYDKSPAGTAVHLDQLDFSAANPKLADGVVVIRGDLDIREGQRVVVGNTGLGTPGNAIILVLSARVLD